MSIFATLFGRRAPRHYALLDERQCCCMLLTAEESPGDGRWVEIPEIRLALIGKPLPQADFLQKVHA